MNENKFTLVSLRPDGVSPAIELVSTADLEGAVAAANAFLFEHSSCDVVEVWAEAIKLATVGRAFG